MSLEEEITYDISRHIAQEIDFELLTDVLIACGWHKVVLRPMTHERSNAIDHWVSTTVANKHKTLGLVWIFENSGDAVNFALKWS